MAFTVSDFEDLIKLLAQHPEWRAELRRHVLSDDLIELPSLVRQLVEAQTRSEARLDRVEHRLDGVEAALERLADAQSRTEAVVAELGRSQAELAARLERVVDRLGEMDGKLLELDFDRKGPACLGPLARRLRVIQTGPLADLLDDAVDEGSLTNEERTAILRADVVMSGRRRQDSQDIYLVIEVSNTVDSHDVERAATRATLLARLGRPVVSVVAGRRILSDAAGLSRALGVWYADEGQLTSPQSPS